MFRIFHICLFESLRRFLLKSFTKARGEIVYCPLFDYVLNYMVNGMLL